MSHLVKLLRHTPKDSLQAYLEAAEISLADELRGLDPAEDHVPRLLKAVDELIPEEHARLTVDAERVSEMADEVGQTALLSVVEDRLLVEELENGHDRSLWVFLNEPQSFRRAEEIRFTDHYRQGRMWSGYEGPAGITPAVTPEALAAFRGEAIALFRCLDGYCEIYQRTRPNFESPDSELHQLTFYRDGLPDSYFELENRHLVRRHRRPVVELSITYEPATGLIEVVSQGGKVRDELARIFARTILAHEIDGDRLQLRRFDLSALLRPVHLALDPEDGIASMRVTLLRLQRLGKEKARTTLEVLRGYEGTIWDHAQEEVGAQDLAAAGYIVTQAKVVFKFYPGPGQRQGSSLPITITVPHGCDLKNRTERERMLGSKYLERLGVMVEI